MECPGSVTFYKKVYISSGILLEIENLFWFLFNIFSY